jgi:hypothetical protein
MTAGGEVDSDDAPLKQIHVELLIRHPSLTPAEISAALGLEAHRSARVGDPRKTPKGRPLPGYYARTAWRYITEYELTEQWFTDKIALLVDRLVPHREFLRHVRATHGDACIIVQFLTDSYFSDEVDLNTLSKMVDLQLDFGIERY